MSSSSETGAFVQTPSQTVGPFFGYALPYQGGADVVDRTHPAAIRLHGRVFDGAGVGVPDAIVEVWQPDESGVISTELGSFERDGYTFTGFGRVPTTRAGDYTFTTVKPGVAVAGGVAGVAVAGGDATGAGHPEAGAASAAVAVAGAPYALITVFARGLLHHLFTRAYFVDADGAESFESFAQTDATLSTVLADRRATLVASQDGPGSYRFDITLQGDNETVFFDFDA
ncbi:dioxygenase family protein [Subtercola sp. YIM 133946]|uniref:dioxygenase family protein n=1 Tax=Subtercola sp. YIM 133946 TaxID=3118909 RepID=UPI002F9345CA